MASRAAVTACGATDYGALRHAVGESSEETPRRQPDPYGAEQPRLRWRRAARPQTPVYVHSHGSPPWRPGGALSGGYCAVAARAKRLQKLLSCSSDRSRPVGRGPVRRELSRRSGRCPGARSRNEAGWGPYNPNTRVGEEKFQAMARGGMAAGLERRRRSAQPFRVRPRVARIGLSGADSYSGLNRLTARSSAANWRGSGAGVGVSFGSIAAIAARAIAPGVLA